MTLHFNQREERDGRHANRRRNWVAEEKDEVCCPPRVIKVVSGARGLMGWRNVVIGSLLWWSTLLQQLAFSPPTPSQLPPPPLHVLNTLLLYAPPYRELQGSGYENTNTVKVKHLPAEDQLRFRAASFFSPLQGESRTHLFSCRSSSTWQKLPRFLKSLAYSHFQHKQFEEIRLFSFQGGFFRVFLLTLF